MLFEPASAPENQVDRQMPSLSEAQERSLVFRLKRHLIRHGKLKLKDINEGTFTAKVLSTQETKSAIFKDPKFDARYYYLTHTYHDEEKENIQKYVLSLDKDGRLLDVITPYKPSRRNFLRELIGITGVAATAAVTAPFQQEQREAAEQAVLKKENTASTKPAKVHELRRRVQIEDVSQKNWDDFFKKNEQYWPGFEASYQDHFSEPIATGETLKSSQIIKFLCEEVKVSETVTTRLNLKDLYRNLSNLKQRAILTRDALSASEAEGFLPFLRVLQSIYNIDWDNERQEVHLLFSADVNERANVVLQIGDREEHIITLPLLENLTIHQSIEAIFDYSGDGLSSPGIHEQYMFVWDSVSHVIKLRELTQSGSGILAFFRNLAFSWYFFDFPQYVSMQEEEQ